MGRNLMAQIAKYLSSRKRRKLGYWVLCSLGAVVVFCTTYALILPAITMSNDPICGMEAHTHSESCWTLQAIVPGTELICGDWTEADVVLHRHDSFCYDGQGGLICPLEEREAHVHDESCYVEQRELICGKSAGEAEEAEDSGAAPQQTPGGGAHVHTDACYRYERGEELACGQEETGGHRHDESCYTLEETGDVILICGDPEGHYHDDSCWYIEESVTTVLACGQEESEDHTHTDACYLLQAEQQPPVLICEEPEGHQHTDACYQIEKLPPVLSCGQEEDGGHQHSDACYEWEPVLVCAEMEAPEDGSELPEDGFFHVHSEECYEITPILVCQEEEYILHTHGEECYETILVDDGQGGEEPVQRLICTLPVVIEHQHTQECVQVEEAEDREAMVRTCGLTVHVHDDSCFVDRGPDPDPWFCGLSEHFHTVECYFESGELRCTIPEHTHTDECLDPDNFPDPEYPLDVPEEDGDEDGEDGGDEYVCGLEEHWHEDECYSEDGELVCALGEHVHDESCLPEDEEEPEEDGEDGPAEYICGLSEHFHTTDCRTEDGDLVCGQEEHTHDETCLPEDAGRQREIQFIDAVYPYESDAFEFVVTFHVDGTALLPEEVDGPDSNADAGANFQNLDAKYGDETTSPAEDISGDGQLPEREAATEDNAPEREPEDVSGAPDGFLTEDGEDAQWTGEDVAFFLEPVDETDPEYEAARAQAMEGLEEEDLLLVHVMRVAARIGEQKLDLSGCTIGMEIRPSEQLIAALSSDVMTLDLNEPEIPAADDSEEPVVEPVYLLKANTLNSEAEVMELSSGTLNEEDAEIELTSEDNGIVCFSLSNTANPKFTVQYYAYLDTVAAEDWKDEGKGSSLLPVIDTSGKNLPQNVPESDQKLKGIRVGSDGRIITNQHELTKIYESPKPFEYIKHPNISYFDIVTKIGGHDGANSYELKEIWVMNEDIPDNPQRQHGITIENYGANTNRDEKAPDGTAVWTVYQWDGGENIHFTNRPEAAGNGYILIEDNALIRLVYETVTVTTEPFDVTFHDYDISTGVHTTSGAVTIMDTAAAGINSTLNCDADVKLAFGNANAGTNYGKVTDAAGNEFNAHNGDVYQGCTFGLVEQQLDENGNIKFVVAAPEIFGGDSAIGKTSYNTENNGCGLKFNRVGDTYTLSAVTGMGANVTGLESFNHPGYTSDNIHTHLWTNNFWPMDGKENADFQFGDYTAYTSKTLRYKPGGEWNSLPASDDGQNHNSYFGMEFGVSFELTGGYTGPLEYYFFGDDDMWVYLSELDENDKPIPGTSQLIIDIGGVHSSVGEYVNLWDYIDKGDAAAAGETGKKYGLHFYYTERGASGSTCWMQFTLPSVCSLNAEQTTGQKVGALIIEKKVSGVESEAAREMEFEFELKLEGPNGELVDDYSYSRWGYRRDENGKIVLDKKGQPIFEAIETNLVIASGQTFRLRADEYIQILYLPEGTTYTVTEAEDPVFHTKVEYNTGEITAGTVATETVHKDKENRARFINTASYKLPETGGPSAFMYTTGGALLCMAAVCLLYKQNKSRRRGAVDRT